MTSRGAQKIAAKGNKRLKSSEPAPSFQFETDAEPNHFAFCALPEHYFERATSSGFIRVGESEGGKASVDGFSSSAESPLTTGGNPLSKAGLVLQRWSSPTAFGK